MLNSIFKMHHVIIFEITYFSTAITANQMVYCYNRWSYVNIFVFVVHRIGDSDVGDNRTLVTKV